MMHEGYISSLCFGANWTNLESEFSSIHQAKDLLKELYYFINFATRPSAWKIMKHKFEIEFFFFLQ